MRDLDVEIQVVPFCTHKEPCPKCGSDHAFVRKHCFGHINFDDPEECKADGEHLHVYCDECEALIGKESCADENELNEF